MKIGIKKKLKMVVLLSVMCLGLEGCGKEQETYSPQKYIKESENVQMSESRNESADDIEAETEPEEAVMGKNMMIAEINGERVVLYLSSTYDYGDSFDAMYHAYNPRGEVLHCFQIKIDKDYESPGIYISSEIDKTYCETCFALFDEESSNDWYTAENFSDGTGNFTYEITDRDETCTHYQGNFDAVLARPNTYSGADKETEMAVSGEFDFTLGEVHEKVAEMEEKSQSGQVDDISEPQQTAVTDPENSGKSYNAQLCSYCSGTGACSYCGGLGDCEKCIGMGYDYCDSCFGSGNCQRCYGQGGEYRYVVGGDNKWVECTSCHGTGNCSRCSGNGQQTCNYCNGSGDCSCCYGSGDCQYCMGSGQL